MENILDSIPNEIIHKICKHLSVFDRLNFGLTCLRFYEITQHISFINEIELIFDPSELTWPPSIIKPLLNSTRIYSNMLFRGIVFSEDNNDDDEFWSKFGKNIKSLTMIDCEFKTLKKYVSVLKQIPNLISFDIDCVTVNDDYYYDVLDGNEMDILKDNFKNIITLKIKCWYHVSNILIEKLIDFFPNVKYLTLSGFAGTPELNPHESWGFVRKYLIIQAEKLKKLNIQFYLSDSELLELLQIKGFDLEDLQLEFYYYNNYDNRFCEFLKSQKNLKSLKFCSEKIIDIHIKTICNNLKDLKIFEINATKMTDVGLTELLQFKNLKSLALTNLYITDPWTVMINNMDKFKNDNLKKLNVRFCALEKNAEFNKFFKDITVNYKNLQCLYLDVNEFNDFWLQTIIENLIYLRKLEIDKCSEVTDFGICGERNTDVDEINSVKGWSISNLKNLEFLCLKMVEQISDKSFTEISKCIHLEKLIIYSPMMNINPQKLNFTLMKCFKLRSMHLYNCDELMLNAIPIIKENLSPQLAVRYLIQ